MRQINQNDIVMARIPFSNSSGSKVRPSIVLSNNSYNEEDFDLILIPLYSKSTQNKYSFKLDNNLKFGNLRSESYIRINKITNIDKIIITKKLGEVNFVVMERIRNELLELIL